jgi:uncharacterized membrane protein YoaK (UPF0700 family)
MRLHPHVISATLSFVAGYVDTLCFVALFGLFTAHVTGNFVLIGSELVNPSQGMLLKWLAFPAFVLGVVAARLLGARAAGPERTPGRSLLVLQCGLLGAGLLAGARAQPSVLPHDTWSIAAGILVAAAMGVQNAAARLAWGALSPTTVMTGNVTQVVIDLVDVVRGDGGDAKARVPRLAWPILAFALGAISGAFAYDALRFWGLSLPLALLALLAASLGRKG